MRPFVLLITMLALFTGTGFFANQAKLDPDFGFRIEQQSNDLLVTWQTALEDGVVRFELQRSSPSTGGQFIDIAEVAPHGSRQPYQFRDDKVYKTSSDQVEYRLEAVYQDGGREVVGGGRIGYAPTAVRRTWGSIKAMFQ